MARTVLKAFLMIICSFYIYVKLQNLQLTKKSCLICALYSVAASFISYLFYLINPALIITGMLLCIIIYNIAVYRKHLYIIISFSVISTALSYLAFFVNLFLSSPINYPVYFKFRNWPYIDIITIIIIALFETVFMILIFKQNRLKHGIPFLTMRAGNNIGVFLGTAVLIIGSGFYVSYGKTFFSFLIPVLILITIVLILWWRTLLYDKYMDENFKRNTRDYNQKLEEKQAELDNVKRHNDELAKIIHKDNKLIPAMELAVKELIASGKNEISSEQADSLLSQLNILSDERKKILTDYEACSKALPDIKVASVFGVVKYLNQRALNLNIRFDVSVMCDIKYLTSEIISENDFNTLLSDLGENAVISASGVPDGHIFISVCIEDNSYRLNIHDNGPDFDANVILNLGKQRYTTHKQTGGSGIGLMTVYEILNADKASFLIDELPGDSNYTKKVSVIFNNKSQFLIKTTRNEILALSGTRNDIIFL